jgi:anti-sigma B factor antagonist
LRGQENPVDAEEQFEVSVETGGPLPVVRVMGELDSATAPAMRRALTEVIAENPGRRILVDLAQMAFIDSTGLGVLVGALKRTRDQGGDLLLASPTSMTTRVLDVTGMCRVFEVVDLSRPTPAPA